MPTPSVFAILAAAGGLWFVGHKTVEGVKKLDHKIAHVFHTKKPQADKK